MFSKSVLRAPVTSLRFCAATLLVTAAVVMLTACGGGSNGAPTDGGSDGGAPTRNEPAPSAVALTCDPAAEASKVPRTPAITSPLRYTFSLNDVNVSPTYERWKMTIGGMQHELNVAISRPANQASIVGIIIDAHGHAKWQETATPQMMMSDTFLHSRYASRGYIAVTVARRGNFGSTGDRLSSSTDSGEATKYQSDSLVATIGLLSTMPAFSPHMKNMVLVGHSGGAPTVLQTAVDSPQFASATHRAIIRSAGYDSALDVDPASTLRMRAYLSTLTALSNSPSLWFVGTDDPITSFEKTACEFKAFKPASPESTFYGVDGFKHGTPAFVFSDPLSPTFYAYMRARGMPNF